MISYYVELFVYHYELFLYARFLALLRNFRQKFSGMGDISHLTNFWKK